MKVAVDTNILARVIVHDDERQAVLAERVLSEADVVAVGLTCLCELAWLLHSRYRFKDQQVAVAIRVLLAAANVEVDRAAVESGLAVLDAGGDFADGVIAFEGLALGGETFVSFDKKAVGLLAEQGVRTRLL